MKNKTKRKSAKTAHYRELAVSADPEMRIKALDWLGKRASAIRFSPTPKR
jgi:hypothetical protein